MKRASWRNSDGGFNYFEVKKKELNDITPQNAMMFAYRRQFIPQADSGSITFYLTSALKGTFLSASPFELIAGLKKALANLLATPQAHFC